MVDADKLVFFDVSNSDDTDIVFVEQFVQSVIGFSSQYGSDVSISYTAYNITGKPSKFPDYGDFPQAFVMVCYTLRVYVTQEMSFDTYNCSVVERVLKINCIITIHPAPIPCGISYRTIFFSCPTSVCYIQ
jgi:hypothetical protein